MAGVVIEDDPHDPMLGLVVSIAVMLALWAVVLWVVVGR